MKANLAELVDYLVANEIFMEQAVELLERMLIEQTLEKTGGNQLQAARLLGIHRNTLRRKVASFEAQPKATRGKPPVRAGRTGRVVKRRAS